jgi:putative FmdB family regulatory protein
MPIYEYRCNACEYELEKLQKMSDEPLTDCPACGQSELKRLISAAGFRLKGGGWYETDFKKDGKRNLAGDSQPAKSESGGESKSSDSSKSDSPKKSDSSSSSKATEKAA